jgi:hypothetical protein
LLFVRVFQRWRTGLPLISEGNLDQSTGKFLGAAELPLNTAAERL